jgi:hypothetical protein
MVGGIRSGYPLFGLSELTHRAGAAYEPPWTHPAETTVRLKKHAPAKTTGQMLSQRLHGAAENIGERFKSPRDLNKSPWTPASVVLVRRDRSLNLEVDGPPRAS